MSLINAGQIKTRETRNSIERLSGDIGSLLNILRDSGCSINDLPVAARLHRDLLGIIRTQSEGETLELLMTTNFINSEVPQETASSSSARRARRSDWRVAGRVVRL